MRSLCACLVLALLAAACGDDSVPEPAPAPDVVVRTDAATASECPHGGTVVRAGPDRDADGLLDVDEVTSATPVCQAAPPTIEPLPPPPAVLTATRPEPIGAHCPGGGTAVLSGRDTDKDGVLDADEVEATGYVCSAPLLTRFEALPEQSASCPAGGVKVFAGRDTNGDGTLQPAEVQHTDDECDDIFDRDLNLGSDADVALLSHVRLVTGNLGVAQGVTALVLPALERIDGDLSTFGATATTTVALPALTRVGGSLTIERHPHLTRIDLPKLSTVGGPLSIGGLAELTSLDLRSLQVVGRWLFISGNAKLPAVDLGALARFGTWWGREDAVDLRVSGNPSMTSLSFGALQCSDREVEINGNAALTTATISCDSARALRMANNGLERLQLSLGSRASLVEISASPLTSLELEGNLIDRVHIQSPTLHAIKGPTPRPGQTHIYTLRVDAPLDEVPSQGISSIELVHTRLTELKLDEAHGSLTLRDNPALAHVRVKSVAHITASMNPLLQSIDIAEPRHHDTPQGSGDVYLAGNPSLEHAPWLADIGEVSGMHIIGSPRLQVPAIWRFAVTGSPLRPGLFGGVHLGDIDGLDQLDVTVTALSWLVVDHTGLRSLRVESRGPSAVSNPSVYLTDNARLATADITGHFLPELELIIERNAALSQLELRGTMPAAANVSIVDNDALPACVAQAILDRIDTSLTETQSGNNGACPPLAP